MKGKINKGFAFYLFIVLGIALGAFAVCIVIMIFVPGFNLFGLRAYNENFKDVRVNKMAVYSSIDEDKPTESKLIESETGIKNIEINANTHSVRIIKSNEMQGLNYDSFLIIFNHQRIGFTTEEVADSGLSVSYYTDTKTLKITASSPEGFLNFGGTASVFVQIPPGYDTSDIDLKINAKQSVVVGDEFSSQSNRTPSTVHFKSIDIKTEKDIVVTKYATMGSGATKDCSFITKSGKITINTPIKADNLTLEVEDESTVRINEGVQANGIFRLATKNTFVYMDNFSASKTILKNAYGKMYFKEAEGDVIIDADSYKCIYQFENIAGNLIMGSYFDEYMVEGGSILVSEGVSGDIILAATGNIDINRVTGSVAIKGTTGNIKINQVLGEVRVSSVDGNVHIGSEEIRVEGRTDILVTGRGDIKIYFESFKYEEPLGGRVKAKSGNVEVYLVKDEDLDLKAKAGKHLEYLTVIIKEKEGDWQVGEAKELYVESNAYVKIFAK